MNEGIWKRNLRRGVALALTLVMSLPIVACDAAQERLAAQAAGDAGVATHETVPYSRRPYEHYGPVVMKQAMADSEQTCAVEGRGGEMLGLYDVIMGEYGHLVALIYTAQLKYDADVSDEWAASGQAYTTNIYFEIRDRATACLEKGMNSPYEEILTDKTGIENVPYTKYFRKSIRELTELSRKEEELLREYGKLAIGDFTAEPENGQQSYSRLEQEPDLDDGQYAEIEDALVREESRVLDSKFRELAHVRRRIVELKSYGNYSQYSFKIVYGKDCALQNTEGFCTDVKTGIVPLNDGTWHTNVTQELYDSLDLMEESSVEDILACVGRTVQSVNPELGEILRYTQDNELHDIRSGEDGQDRVDNNCTIGFPSCGDALTFINRNHTSTDCQSLIHEFGHFGSYYYSSVPELSQGYSVDVCEVQSQALKMLANQYTGDMFGEGAEAFKFESVTGMLHVTATSCMLQEFKEAAYTEPDMSLEGMNRMSKEIQDSHHGWYYDIYDEGVYYGWVDVSHLLYSPLYYMRYETSALPALDLWTTSRSDWDSAVDTYMGLLHESLDVPYCGTMYRCGLWGVFDSGELESLAGGARKLQGLEQGGKGPEVPSQEDAGRAGTNPEGRPGSGLKVVSLLVMTGIYVILAFQIMALCTGFVIIWLLVRKKREEQ